MSMTWARICQGLIFPLMTGLLLAVSFPLSISGYEFPNLAFIAWIAFIPLLYSIRGAKLLPVFLRALVTGLTFSFLSLSWILSFLHNNVGYPLWASFACLGFIVIIISLYIGLAFASAVKIHRSTKIPLYLLLPIAWIVYEYLTNHFPLGGFPWINLGYSQQYYLYMIQSSDIFGVLGISSLIVFINVLLFEAIRSCRNGFNKRALVFGGVTLCLFVVNLGYGSFRVSEIDSLLAVNTELI